MAEYSFLKKGQAVRERIRAQCVTPEAATAAGYRAVTQGYAIRQFDQCETIEKAVEGMGSVDYKLVIDKGRVSIWRKKA